MIGIIEVIGSDDVVRHSIHGGKVEGRLSGRSFAFGTSGDLRHRPRRYAPALNGAGSPPAVGQLQLLLMLVLLVRA